MPNNRNTTLFSLHMRKELHGGMRTEISTGIGVVVRTYGVKEAIRVCKEAGFDCLDFSFSDDRVPWDTETVNGADLYKSAEEIRKYADGIGIYFNQAHAPFIYKHEAYEKRCQDTVLALEIASILGVRQIVVHPLQKTREGTGDRKALKEQNFEFYGELLPYAEKYRVRILVENMFNLDRRRGCMEHSTCADPDEFCEYIDYESVVKALADIGYDGEFNLESFSFLKWMEPDFMPKALRFMAERARYLADKLDGYRK